MTEIVKPREHKTFKVCSQCTKFKRRCLIGYNTTSKSTRCSQGILKFKSKKQTATRRRWSW